MFWRMQLLAGRVRGWLTGRKWMTNLSASWMLIWNF
jgi:hypothetical protein